MYSRDAQNWPGGPPRAFLVALRLVIYRQNNCLYCTLSDPSTSALLKGPMRRWSFIERCVAILLQHYKVHQEKPLRMFQGSQVGMSSEDQATDAQATLKLI